MKEVKRWPALAGLDELLPPAERLQPRLFEFRPLFALLGNLDTIANGVPIEPDVLWYLEQMPVGGRQPLAGNLRLAGRDGKDDCFGHRAQQREAFFFCSFREQNAIERGMKRVRVRVRI